MTCFCWSFWINNFLSSKKDSETRFWFSRRKNFHVSLLLIKILFYLLTHSLWFKFTYLTAFVNLLLSFNFLFIGAALLLISTWLYSNPAVQSSSQRKEGLVWSTLNSRRRSSNILIIVKPLQTNRSYLILIPLNTKSILTIFDRFDHNYGSICVCVLQ